MAVGIRGTRYIGNSCSGEWETVRRLRAAATGREKTPSLASEQDYLTPASQKPVWPRSRTQKRMRSSGQVTDWPQVADILPSAASTYTSRASGGTLSPW